MRQELWVILGNSDKSCGSHRNLYLLIADDRSEPQISPGWPTVTNVGFTLLFMSEI